MFRRYATDLRRLGPAARSYLLGSTLMGAAQAIPWTLLALYLDELAYSKQEIGFVQASDSWGKVLVAIPAAFLLARRAAGPIFVRAALVAALGYILLPWMGSRSLIALCAFVAGFAFTVHYVAVAPFLFRHTSSTERAAVYSVAEAVRTLAMVAGALGAGVMVDLLGPVMGRREALGLAISLAGGLCLASGWVFARIQDEDPEWEPGQRVRTVLREHRGILLRFAIPQFLIASGAGFCIPFLSLYFKERFGFTPGDWSRLFSGGQVLMTTGFLVTPFVLSRLGFVRSIVFIELCSIPFFVVLAFTHSPLVAMLAFLCRGALMNSTHPIHKNFMMQATAAGAREVQNGINATLWGVGWVVGPLAAGRVLDATGNDYTVLMLTTVLFYLTAAVFTWVLLKPVEGGLVQEEHGPVITRLERASGTQGPGGEAATGEPLQESRD